MKKDVIILPILGVSIGIIVGFYKLLSCTIEELYLIVNKDPILAMLWIVVTILSVLTINFLLKLEPYIARGGIAHIRAILMDKIRYNPVKLVLLKILGGALTFLSGFSLGKAGPSIQIGGSIGMLFSREKEMIWAGAAAGIAAAFEAPLAGVASAIEILGAPMNFRLVLILLFTSLISALVSKLLFPMNLSISYSPLTLSSYQILVTLGIASGFYAVILTEALRFSIIKSRGLRVKLALPLVESWLLLFVMPLALGGGHNLVRRLLSGGLCLEMAFVLLLLKSIHTVLSFSSDAPGGLVLPVLAIGALMGNIIGGDVNFILAGMASFFAGMLRAPLTGSLLLMELSGDPRVFLEVFIPSLISYSVVRLSRIEPIQGTLLKLVSTQQLNY
ncbi:chloride channel protein [Pyrococcus sp. NA2]|uniref:chloride channel protein n=1 Tax=Pyrococcus sp. (strain NA2) TaxID=342949 RepID=UPI0013052A53|nr:chloride channel protein [Pyrococcus sp. NA2]